MQKRVVSKVQQVSKRVQEVHLDPVTAETGANQVECSEASGPGAATSWLCRRWTLNTSHIVHGTRPATDARKAVGNASTFV